MLDRVNFALRNPILDSLGKGRERDLFIGFSAQTLGRYKRVIRAANDVGLDLSRFRPVNYKDIDALLQATPAERERILQMAILTKGQRIIHSKPDLALGAKPGSTSTHTASRGTAATVAAHAAATAVAAAHDDDDADDHSSDNSDDDEGGGGAALAAASAAFADRSSASGLHPGQVPVERMDVLFMPPPSEEQLNDPLSVYVRRGVPSAPGPTERKRLLEFLKQRGLFAEDGLLPFKSAQFGALHEMRKNAAIRMIQDEFRTCASWTRKFLAYAHKEASQPSHSNSTATALSLAVSRVSLCAALVLATDPRTATTAASGLSDSETCSPSRLAQQQQPIAPR